MALARQSPPNMIGVVSDLARRYPSAWRAAHANYRAGVRDPRGELFIRLLAWELHHKHDARWGWNGKRGNAGDPSQDAINWKMSDTDRVVIDVIGGAGGPNPYPAWTVNSSHGDDRGRWMQPSAVSQAEIDRILGTGSGGGTSAPKPSPSPAPARPRDFKLKRYPAFKWPPSDSWLEVAANNVLAIAEDLKVSADLEDIGKALYHALRTPGDVNKVIKASLKPGVAVASGYPEGKKAHEPPYSEAQIMRFVERSSQLIREYRPWVIDGRIEKQGGKWQMEGGGLALTASVPSFANFLELFLRGDAEADVVAFITKHPEHANFQKWQQGKHPAQAGKAPSVPGPRPTPGTPSRPQGAVTANRHAFADRRGAFIPVGCSLFCAPWLFQHDRPRLKKNAQWMAKEGFDFVRWIGELSREPWRARLQNPLAKGFEAVARDLLEFFYEYGLRSQPTIFGEWEYANTDAERREVVELFARAFNSREPTLLYGEIGNECGKPGRWDDIGEIRSLAGLLRQREPHLLIALTSPTSRDHARRLYEGSAANVFHFHDQRTPGSEGVRRGDVHGIPGIPALRVSGEPRGPGASAGGNVNDPAVLATDLRESVQAGVGAYVYHSHAGVWMGAQGSPANLWEQPHADACVRAIIKARDALPGDQANR